jgi:hypothetical protein
MSLKLTDTQIVMLSAAGQRHDRCLLAPQILKGSATSPAAAAREWQAGRSSFPALSAKAGSTSGCMTFVEPPEPL